MNQNAMRILDEILQDFNRGAGFYLQTKAGKDLGEGPWTNPVEALHFFDSEVGVACRLVRVDCNSSITPWTKWLKP